MHTATELLCEYATYHRDRRNIASHFVGVPLIVFAAGLLLAKPAYVFTSAFGSLVLSPAWLLFALAAAWYLTRGLPMLGLAVSAATALLLMLAQQFDASTSSRLGWGASLFVLGWVIQFVGHWYEGRKPAFLQDLTSLLVGPMFVTAEALFALGWLKPLQADIERYAGPTQLRDLARIA